jgi:hypothetical protein
MDATLVACAALIGRSTPVECLLLQEVTDTAAVKLVILPVQKFVCGSI